MTALTASLISSKIIIVLFVLDPPQRTQWSCYHVDIQADVPTASLSCEIIQITIVLIGEATIVDSFIVIYIFRRNQYTARCADDAYCLFVQIIKFNHAKYRDKEIN